MLEVAAGTGQFTESLARDAKTVLATDVAPNMVEALTMKLASSSLSNVEAKVMSAYELDCADASFEAVFCANALHVMDEPQRALAEFRRVLVDDGVLIVPTFLHGTDPFRRGLSRSMSVVSPFVAKIRLDLDGLSSLVATAGFAVTYAERMPGLLPLGYVVARPKTLTTVE